MGQLVGVLTMAAQLGIQSILVKPKRGIGPFLAQVTLREKHSDELEMTDHPVEQGSQITDHAFMKPVEVIIECAWSNSPQAKGLIDGLVSAATSTVAGVSAIFSGNSIDQVRDVYQRLLALQRSRVLIDVFTGKRTYSNMLIKSLETETDKETANVLRCTVHLREVIIAQVQTVSAVPAASQALPSSTQSVLDKGQKQLVDGAKTVNLGRAISALTPSLADTLPRLP
jgi:hypothetical protein